MNRVCLLVLVSVVHFYKTEALNYQCAVCVMGKYKSLTSNNQCVMCPANTYQDSFGATSVTQCKPCPSNSYSPEGSARSTDCLCGLGYTGDVATFLTGTQTDNLQRSCGGALSDPCATLQSNEQLPSSNAVDTSMSTQSSALLATSGGWAGMTTWWRVMFQREAVVQRLNIVNTELLYTLNSFSIRVGNVPEPANQAQNSLCASNLQWTAGTTSMAVTCTQAVRGQYLYIINGDTGRIVLNNVQVFGYLLPGSEVCLACASGKFKASNGTAACTN